MVISKVKVIYYCCLCSHGYHMMLRDARCMRLKICSFFFSATELFTLNEYKSTLVAGEKITLLNQLPVGLSGRY